MRARIAPALLAAAALGLAAGSAAAAPKADLWERWQAHDPGSTTVVDHGAWGGFLKAYLVVDDPSGINRLPYGAVTAADRAELAGYVDRLAGTAVSALSRPEQKAFWINLYNALTVKVVLEHYPVSSIRKIRLGGWFSGGPWDEKLVAVEGERVSLNDIEHRILRPIWRDNRIHYGVNCASIGCPNLAPEPYTAANTDRLLEEGARAYVNHPRGVELADGILTLSKIYQWYQADFDGSEQGVLRHLERFAAPALAEALKGFHGSIRYRYDWDLNE